MTTAPRTLAAVLLALALGAAGCAGGGTADTAAPDTAPPETTAPPTTTAPPAPSTTADPCRFTATSTGWWTSQARDLMDAAETADGPVPESVIEQIAEIRRDTRHDRGCPGVWDDEDDARLAALAARVGEEAPEAGPDPEAGDRPRHRERRPGERR